MALPTVADTEFSTMLSSKRVWAGFQHLTSRHTRICVARNCLLAIDPCSLMASYTASQTLAEGAYTCALAPPTTHSLVCTSPAF